MAPVRTLRRGGDALERLLRQQGQAAVGKPAGAHAMHAAIVVVRSFDTDGRGLPRRHSAPAQPRP